MGLAGRYEPFKPGRILYSGEIFEDGFRAVAAAPGYVQAVLRREAHPAVPGENSVHEPRNFGKIFESEPGRPPGTKILLHRRSLLSKADFDRKGANSKYI